MEIYNLLLKYFVVSVSRTLETNSLLFSYFVTPINKTEDGQPLAV
jgi:hypothetical protein